MLGATRSSTGTCAGTLWTLSRGKAGFNGTAGSPSAARLCVSWEQTSGPNRQAGESPWATIQRLAEQRLADESGLALARAIKVCASRIS